MMRRTLRYALLADGSSDRALLPVIGWVLDQHAADLDYPEPGFRPRAHDRPFAAEIAAAIEELLPDILFVHRDAETVDLEKRRQEIPDGERPVVRVVPVRKRFHRDLGSVVHRVAELVRDYAPLRAAAAFRRFESDCIEALREWRGGRGLATSQ